MERKETAKIKLAERKKEFKKEFKAEGDKVIKFLEKLNRGEINKRKKVGEARQVKYLEMLKIFLRNYTKPLNSLTKKDMTDFIDNLENNTILKKNGEPYSDKTKQDFKVNLIVYLKYRLPKKYTTLTDWIDTSCPKKSPVILTEAEIEKLYRHCRTDEQRFIIAVLFDGGFRAGEFLNIRIEDIQEPTQDFPYYRIEAKEEFSKTDGRTIGLYWKHSTEAIRTYLESLDKTDKSKPVVDKEYDALRLFLTRLGKRVLDKRVHFHMFRKSSATFYATKMGDRQKLCIRYGWKFSSDMPDIYIKKSGAQEEAIKEGILGNDLEKVQKELQKERETNNIKINSLQEQMQEMYKMLIEKQGKKVPKKNYEVIETEGISPEDRFQVVRMKA